MLRRTIEFCSMYERQLGDSWCMGVDMMDMNELVQDKVETEQL